MLCYLKRLQLFYECQIKVHLRCRFNDSLILVEENYLSYIVLINKKTVFMIDIKNAPDTEVT